MTLNYGLFDVSDPENPDRVYSAALLSRIVSKHIRDGIVHGDGGELAVTVTDPPAMTVLVGTGTAMVQGRFCENDAALTLSVPAAHATYPRIDRVVVRLSASPGRVVDIVVKPGTAAPEPAAPALTRTAETWELSLAQIRVEAGATSILSAKITDERASMTLCGEANPAYVRSDSLTVVENLAMAGNKITGLGAPTADADAATKAYVNQEVASFGISDITIDADKDWNGKGITNVGAIDVVGNATFDGGLWTQYGQLLAPPTQDAIFRVYQDNSTKCTTTAPGYVMKSVTIQSRYVVPGSIYVKFNHTGVGVSRIDVNGIASITSSGVLNDIKAGDVIGVYVSGNNDSQGCNSLFEIFALDMPISKGRPW